MDIEITGISSTPTDLHVELSCEVFVGNGNNITVNYFYNSDGLTPKYMNNQKMNMLDQDIQREIEKRSAAIYCLLNPDFPKDL